MSGGQGDELNLNLTEPCGSGLKNECKCPLPKPEDIRATRVTDHPVKGYITQTHERTNQGIFILPKILGDKSQFENGPILDVKKVEAYYGNQRATKPLILAITTSSSTTPTYYINEDGYTGDSTGEGTWIPDGNINQNTLVKWLDEFNCQYNDTIPIDLKNPRDLSRLYLENGGCLRNRTVSISGTNVTGEYEVKTYEINTQKTHISRVAYGDTNTDMTIPTDSVDTIKVYTWTKEEGKVENERTPLLVAFKTDSGKFHYSKNAGNDKDNLKWAQASNNSRTERTGPDLTKLLDEARCNSFYTFKVELSKTSGPYKNNECSKQQIKVQEVEDSSEKLIHYEAYKHTYTGNGKEFIITEFIGTDGKQVFSAISYPIRNVTEVVVYLCKEEPLLVYINSNDPSFSTKKWHKYDKGTKKWECITQYTLSTSSHEEILNILDGLKTDCAPPSVTIDIKEQEKDDGYNDPRGSGKRIKVTKVSSGANDPPQYYDRYDHTVVGRDGSYFTLKTLVHGNRNNTIKIGGSEFPQVSNATKVSVYYWSKLENGKPLLIKVEYRQKKSNPSIKSYARYENQSTDANNTDWKEAEGSDYLSSNDKLKNKLDLLNCRLNNVVIVDAYKQPKDQYCHEEDPEYDIQTLDKEHPPKLKVEEDNASMNKKLATYEAYEHSTTSGDFHIVGFKNGSTGGETSITLDSKGTEDSPIMNVKKVIFYFCNSENSPLMIYYKTTEHNWYKSDDGTWQTVNSDWPTKDPETNSERIIDELDKIGKARNPCRPTEVTIDIKNITEYRDGNVNPVPLSTELNYTEYKHAPKDPNNREYFTITQVNYSGQKISKITKKDKVLDFSVYYWEPLKEKGNPLLIKVVKNGNEVEWYENTSTNKENTDWSDISQYKDKLADQDKLVKKLTLLNCKLNNVTEIDIGKKPESKYCHQGDINIKEESHDPIIQVTDVTQNPTYNGKIGTFVVYEHAVDPKVSGQRTHLGDKFHISGFKNTNTDLQFKDEDSPISALNVPKVLVYFCDKGEKGSPLLIHFKNGKLPSGNHLTDEWYQTTKQGWKSVETGVPKSENDILSIYAILNNYVTSCKDDTLLRILLGTAAGSAGGGATTYGVYEMIRWLFMSPWPRLM